MRTEQSIITAFTTAIVCSALFGCYQGTPADSGESGGADSEGAQSGGAQTGSGESGGESGGADSEGDPGDSGEGSGRKDASPGVRLLTRREYANTVEVLLGVGVDRTEVPAEQVFEGHSNIADAQGVGIGDLEAYYEVGLEAATEYVESTSFGCDVNELTCARSVVEGLLPRAFRGAVADEVKAQYLGMLDEPEAGATVPERLVLVVATALSSPHFLYRTELGRADVEGATQERIRWLTDDEIAVRMSYLLWQSMPDQELLDAAAAGELGAPEGRLVQLDRMLADARARRGLLGFVHDWMGLHQGGIASKSPAVLAGTDPLLSASAESSLDRMVADVLLDEERSFAALLATDRYFADAALGPVLGVEDASVELGPVAVDPAQRTGLLVHPAVLSAHTAEGGPSPFPIGRWIYQNILCETIPPPLELPEVELSEVGELTLREQLEELTASETCQGCHSRIGPPGFAFLAYDPIARYRAADGLGRPWDTSGEIPVGAAMVAFISASDLSMQLSRHENTAACVAQRLFRWTFGRFEAGSELALLTAIKADAVAAQASVRDTLAAIIEVDAFAQVRLGGE